MSALDRLENYHFNADRGTNSVSSTVEVVKEDTLPFDTKTCEGAFLTLVHKRGFAMYTKEGYTELHNALVQNGNQKIQAVAGSGKALINGTKVMTSDGLKSIEDLVVGDKVFGVDGNLYPVQGVFPQGYKTVYEVRLFPSNRVISCCSEHLWGIDDGRVLKTTKLKKGMKLPKTAKLCTCDGIPRLEDFKSSGWVELRSRLEEVFGAVRPKTNSESLRDWYDGVVAIGSVPQSIRKVSCTNERALMTCISVDSPDHLFLLEGCIPTHNTTMLLYKVVHDIVTGEIMTQKVLPTGMTVRVMNKVFVGTFLRSGADELLDKLQKLQGDMGYTVTASQISFGTLHAEFKRCLNAMGVPTNIGKTSHISKLFRQAVDSCHITKDGSKLAKEDYTTIEGIVAYYRGRLDNKKYMHPSCNEFGLTPSILDLLVNQFTKLKNIDGIMDFDDLQELLYKYLYVTPNPKVVDFVAGRYNYMYLDEFQDTSQIQYEIIKAYMHGKCGSNPMNGSKIVVVGDVEQCIYSWRGSDIEIMRKRFDEDFVCVHNALSYNYRCPANILLPVVPSIDRNSEAKDISIKPFNTGGVFFAKAFTTYGHMLRYLVNDLKHNKGTSTILCRTNYDGLVPAFYLEMNNFGFSVSGEQMTLSSPLPKKLVRASAIFTDRGTPLVSDILKMFVPFTMHYAVKQLVDVMKNNRMRLLDVPFEDIKHSCPDLVKLVKTLGSTVDEFGELAGLQALYCMMISDVFYRDNSYCDSARAILEALLLLIDLHDFKSIADYREEIDVLDERLCGRVRRKADIQITTVHEYKGKEADNTYVWNDSAGVFPANKVDIDDIEQLEEERRVHYIACTRARDKNIILTRSGNYGMFLEEMDCTIELVEPSIGGKLRGKKSNEDLESIYSSVDDTWGTDDPLY